MNRSLEIGAPSGESLRRESQTLRFDRLLDAVYPHLNALHNVDRSRRYWGILLYRYLRKCLAAERSGLLHRVPPPVVLDDEAVLGPRAGGSEAGSAGTSAGRRQGGVRGTVLAIRRRLAALPRSVAAFQESLQRRRRPGASPDSSRSILLDFHYYHVVERYVPPPVARFACHVSPPRAWRPSLRRALLETARSAAIARQPDASLVRLALEWLPCAYLEEFQSRESEVRLVAPEEKQFHAAFLPSIEGRLHVAKHVEEGAALYLYQHAASYGEIREHVLHHAESQLADRFMTWGWAIEPNDTPFLALRLMKPAGQEIRRNANASRWVYAIIRQPFPSLLDTTLEVQDRFFSALDAARASNIMLRPRVNKGGGVDDQVSEHARRACGFVDSGTESWGGVAGSARLVILDAFPSTTFLECLVAGIPVMAIVAPTVEFTPLAQRFYDRFFEMGVLHRTPEAAAQFLNRMTDADRWWQSVQEGELLMEYMQLFCRVEPGPMFAVR